MSLRSRVDDINTRNIMPLEPIVDRALLDKYFRGQCSSTEKQTVELWLLNPENDLIARSVMEEQWNSLPLNSEPHIDLSDHLRKLRFKGNIYSSPQPNARKPFMIRALKVAAVWLVLVASLGVLTYRSINFSPDIFSTVARQEIASSAGEITIKVLPDGTKVWLNAKSTLQYDENFMASPFRSVFLEGEAYFDVAEDRQHPFIVHAEGVQIKVLGTAFNVKSYHDDPTVETTLVRGKVSIETTGAKTKVELEPDQQAIFFHAGDTIELSQVKAKRFTTWISGSLEFEDLPVYDVFKSLERWYGVQIYMNDEKNMHCHLTARIDKESLTETMELLESITGIKYTITGKKVYIEGKICDQ